MSSNDVTFIPNERESQKISSKVNRKKGHTWPPEIFLIKTGSRIKVPQPIFYSLNVRHPGYVNTTRNTFQ